MSIAADLAAVRAAVVAAAQRAGRPAAAVRLVAVSKTQSLAAVIEAYDAGARDFGENSAQELAAKAPALAATGRTEARWHFIGRLQRNKAAVVAQYAWRVHSIDRPELLEALARRVPDGGGPLAILLQVNIGAEPQKGGVEPGRLLDLARQVRQHASLKLRGVMAVPPQGEDPAPHFMRLADLQVQLRNAMGSDIDELSMGMSHDFATAIAHGATWVRVGTAIFGARERR